MQDDQWYKKIWSLDIKNASWVEDTEHQVDFIIQKLSLKGDERILDLACGYGRHSLSLARRGFSVVGVDITKAYIDDALEEAKRGELSNTIFVHHDIRDLQYENEFDVVLNLADGAIGYLEDDNENLKIFDAAARALKPGGKHFIDICNAAHAQQYFPKLNWEIGENSLALAEFDWNPETKRMLYGACNIPYHEVMKKPKINLESPTRLYTKDELELIYHKRHMKICSTYANYYGKPDDVKELQLIVYAQKENPVLS